jgi:hypothetical protein
MSKQKYLILGLALTLLSACAKEDTGTASTDANGYCTREFVMSYNDVVKSFKSYKKTYEAAFDEKVVAEAALELSLKGEAFVARYANSKCEALVFESNELKQVQELDLRTNVDTATNVIKARKTGTAIPQKPAEVFTGSEKIYLLDLSLGAQ